jgi:hypothetical protein
MLAPCLRAAVLAVAVSSVALAADAPRADGTPRPPGSAQARLERLKALAGTWAGKAGHGAGDARDATVTWSVTGGGSAVVETVFPGTPHEMMTVYTVDGEDLLLTHYCAAGNQPTMKAKAGGDPGTIAFDFVRGGNMKPSDMHMHSAVITFVSDDALRTEWTSWAGGKPSGTARFELTRRK